jgi:hypothetical protein
MARHACSGLRAVPARDQGALRGTLVGRVVDHRRTPGHSRRHVDALFVGQGARAGRRGHLDVPADRSAALSALQVAGPARHGEHRCQPGPAGLPPGTTHRHGAVACGRGAHAGPAGDAGCAGCGRLARAWRVSPQPAGTAVPQPRAGGAGHRSRPDRRHADCGPNGALACRGARGLSADLHGLGCAVSAVIPAPGIARSPDAQPAGAGAGRPALGLLRCSATTCCRCNPKPRTPCSNSSTSPNAIRRRSGGAR